MALDQFEMSPDLARYLERTVSKAVDRRGLSDVKFANPIVEQEVGPDGSADG